MSRFEISYIYDGRLHTFGMLADSLVADTVATILSRAIGEMVVDLQVYIPTPVGGSAASLIAEIAGGRSLNDVPLVTIGAAEIAASLDQDAASNSEGNEIIAVEFVWNGGGSADNAFTSGALIRPQDTDRLRDAVALALGEDGTGIQVFRWAARTKSDVPRTAVNRAVRIIRDDIDGDITALIAALPD